MSTSPRSPIEQRPDAALPFDDVIAMVRLLGDVAAINGSLPARKRALMEGLAEVIDADAWMWTVSRVHAQTNTATSLGLLHGGFSDKQVLAAIESSQQTDPPLPEHQPIIALLQRGRHFTRTRAQLVDDQTWYASEANQRFRFDNDIDDFLYSLYPCPNGVLSGVGFHRWRDRPRFSDHQRRIVHIVLANVPGIHCAGVPGHEGLAINQLTPRLRTVLMLLLEGRNRDDIARNLSISTHTSKDHISAIYRHFGVSGQVELLHHFQAGDGGDHR